MNRMLLTGLLAGAAAILSPVSAVAQEAEPAFLEVGEPAPDFELVGATRYGILGEPVRLSDFRGETVILAFFFRARTPG
jgi:peroxiredoxin Q/BCP